MHNRIQCFMCPAIVLTALANSNCVSIDSGSGPPDPKALVTIMDADRVSRPGFRRIDGGSAGGRHQVEVTPGSHQAEVVVAWPNGPKETLAFPVEVSQTGNYYIEVLPFPPRRPLPMRTGSSQAFEVVVDELARSFHLDIAALGIAATVAVIVPTHYAEILSDLGDRLPMPVQMVTLRLREGSETGRVVDWRRYDHPDRRKDLGDFHDFTIASAGSGGIGKRPGAGSLIYKDFHLYGKLEAEKLPPATVPSPKPPRLGREFDF